MSVWESASFYIWVDSCDDTTIYEGHWKEILLIDQKRCLVALVTLSLSRYPVLAMTQTRQISYLILWSQAALGQVSPASRVTFTHLADDIIHSAFHWRNIEASSKRSTSEYWVAYWVTINICPGLKVSQRCDTGNPELNPQISSTELASWCRPCVEPHIYRTQCSAPDDRRHFNNICSL